MDIPLLLSDSICNLVPPCPGWASLMVKAIRNHSFTPCQSRHWLTEVPLMTERSLKLWGAPVLPRVFRGGQPGPGLSHRKG